MYGTAFVVFPLAAFLCQMVLVYFFGTHDYWSLHCWDSAWFQTIIDRGYYFDFGPGMASNTSLFPGYPLLSLAVKRVLGVSSPTAELIAAQSVCAGFWIYYFLLLRFLLDFPAAICLLCGFLACQPGSFFMVAAYSESLFLFGLIGATYWYFKGPGWRNMSLAAAHAAIASGTRCVGIPILAFPLFHWTVEKLAKRTPSHSLSAATMVTAGGAAGAGGYFLYCQLRFGRWDTYWEAVRVWGTRSDWLVFFKPPLYKFGFTPFSPDTTGRALAVLSLVLGFIGCRWMVAEDRWKRYPEITTLLLTGIFLLVLTIVGRGGNACTGMVRYLIPVDALVFPTVGLWMKESRGTRWTTFSLLNPIVFIGVFFLLFQLCLVFRFVHQQWVA